MQSNMFPSDRAGAGEGNHRVGSSISLINASTIGVVRVVHCLLNEGAKVDEQDSEGFTPLIAASANSHLAVVECLVAKAQERGDEAAKAMINAQTATGLTALMAAALNGHREVVAFLVSVGAEVDATDQYGQTALLCAAREGHWGLVISLLKAGVTNVNATDQAGHTALHYATCAYDLSFGYVPRIYYKAIIDTIKRINERTAV